MYHWEKTVARSLHWNDHATFDKAGNVTTANVDPFVPFLSRGSAAASTAGRVNSTAGLTAAKTVAEATSAHKVVSSNGIRGSPSVAMFAAGVAVGGGIMMAASSLF